MRRNAGGRVAEVVALSRVVASSVSRLLAASLRRVPCSVAMTPVAGRLLRGCAGAAAARAGRAFRRRERVSPPRSPSRFGQRPGLLFLHHRRRRDHRFRHRHDQVPQHGVVELERVLELVQRFLVALDVHQHVMRLVNLLDRVGELAPAPILEAVDAAAAGRSPSCGTARPSRAPARSGPGWTMNTIS